MYYGRVPLIKNTINYIKKLLENIFKKRHFLNFFIYIPTKYQIALHYLKFLNNLFSISDRK